MHEAPLRSDVITQLAALRMACRERALRHALDYCMCRATRCGRTLSLRSKHCTHQQLQRASLKIQNSPLTCCSAAPSAAPHQPLSCPAAITAHTSNCNEPQTNIPDLHQNSPLTCCSAAPAAPPNQSLCCPAASITHTSNCNEPQTNIPTLHQISSLTCCSAVPAAAPHQLLSCPAA